MDARPGGRVERYIIGVLIYFGALYVLKSKYDRVKQDLASISGSYTNALQGRRANQNSPGPRRS